MRLFLLQWDFFFCRESFLSAVRFFLLPWVFSFLPWVCFFCREVIFFVARLFILPWQLWATVNISMSRFIYLRQDITIKISFYMLKFAFVYIYICYTISTPNKTILSVRHHLTTLWHEQRCLYSYRQRQICQSDCDITANWDKNINLGIDILNLI